MRNFITIGCFGILFFLGLSVTTHASTESQFVTEGRALLFNSGNPTYSGLLAANEKFKAAVTADSADQEANLFYAVTRIFSSALENGGATGLETLRDLFETFGITRNDNDYFKEDLPYNKPPEIYDHYDPPDSIPGGEDVRAFLAGPFVTLLGDAISNLDAITDTAFNITLSAAEIDDDHDVEDNDQDVEVDYGDVLILKSTLYMLKSSILTLTAYDLNINLRELVVLGNGDVFQIQRDILNKYSNAFTLRGDGTTSLASAKQALLNGINAYIDAFTFITAETDDQFNDLFYFESDEDQRKADFLLAQLTELKNSLNENRPAVFTTIEETWIFTDTITGYQLEAKIEKDVSEKFVLGDYRGLNGCEFISCSGRVEEFTVSGTTVTIKVVYDGMYSGSATFTGTIPSESTLISISGTYTEYDDYNNVVISDKPFTATRQSHEEDTKIIDFNFIFGNTDIADPKSPLDIRAILPEFDQYGKPLADTFPPTDDSSPVLNGILPGFTNGALTVKMDLQPSAIALDNASIFGTITCSAYTAGNIFILAYDGPDTDAAIKLGSAYISNISETYTITNLPAGANVYLFAEWDADDNGIKTLGDYIGMSGPHFVSSDSSTSANVTLDTEFSIDYAVHKGLQWLRDNQNTDGSWSTNNMLGATEFAALAFLNNGFDETDATVSNALNFILSKVHDDGSIQDDIEGDQVKNYTTAIGILPLIAADKYNDTEYNDPGKYTDIISKAVRYLINIQNTEVNISNFDVSNLAYGGWGYGEPDPSGGYAWGDISNSQWDVLALSEAKDLVDESIVTKIEIETALSKAMIFFQRCQNRPATNDLFWAHDPNNDSYNDGGFIYSPPDEPFPDEPFPDFYPRSYTTATFAGIWSYLCCGISTDDGRLTDALAWARNDYSPSNWYDRDDRPYYTYYTVAKTLTMAGKAASSVDSDWFYKLSNQLSSLQNPDGSWINYRMDDGGPALITSYAVLSFATQKVSPTATLDITVSGNASLEVTKPDGSTVSGTSGVSIGAGEVLAGNYLIDLTGTADGSYTLIINGIDGTNSIAIEPPVNTISSGETQRFELIAAYITGYQFSLKSETPESTIPRIEIINPSIVSDKGDDLYRITWHDGDLDDNAIIRIYYDNDTDSAENMGEITPSSGIEENASNYLDWDISDLTEGATYYIYAVISDSSTANTAYSAGSVLISPDGMPREWEEANGLNIYRPDGDADIDKDGLSNLEEYVNFTDLNDPDTDFDITPPSAPTDLDLAAEDDTGSSDSDNLTNGTSSLTTSGRGENGATVQLLAGGNPIAETTTVAADGSFFINIDLVQGDYSITAKQTDAAGNVSAASAVLNITVDTAKPLKVADLYGSPLKETWSNDNTVMVNWTAAIDTDGSGLDGYSISWDITPDTVPDTIKDIEEATTTTSDALTDGNSHYFHIRAVDAAGNWGETEHYGPFYIDATIPSDPFQVISSPVTTAIEDETYTYALATNSIGVTYSFVEPYPSGMTIDSDGKIIYKPSSDADAGSHTITVKAKDKWGFDVTQTFTLTVASINDAPYFTSALPETDTRDTLAMPGHVYTFVIEAEDEETENLVYTLKGSPPAGISIKSLDTDYSGARIRWVPSDADAGRTIPLEIEVSDGEKTDTLSYVLTVLNPLVVSPNSPTLLRINEDDLDKDFIISGGFIDDSTPYYSCELIHSDTGNTVSVTTDDYSVDENGVFRYTFSTVDRTGSYRLRVNNGKDFTIMSGPVEIMDITAVPMAMDPVGLIDVAENKSIFTVTDTTKPIYNGATVVVPAGSSTDPFTFTFRQVTNNQINPNKSAVFGDVVEINAAKADGSKVTFDTDVEVTLPYNNIPDIDRPQDLRIYTFNSDLSRWVSVSDYTINTENETISFSATHFSLFTVGQSETLGTGVTGGILRRDYRMISFPCNPDNPNLADVLGSYDTTIWRCAAYNNSAMGYDEASSSGFADTHPLEPGRAYWIISRYDKALKVKGLAMDMEVAFETTLHPGWNMVANPYNEIINSNRITVSDDGMYFDSIATTGLTDNYIFKFDPRDDEQGNTIWYTEISLDNASMEPYEGYWIYSYSSSDMIIRFEPLSAITLKQNGPPLYKKMIWHARRSLHRFMDVIAATCYADGNPAQQPPPPPGLSGNSRDSIGVAGGGSGGCFIATAAYGSKMEPHVRILRDFRDRFLLDNAAGRRFVEFYYTYSPAIAEFIAGHANLQSFVRWSLLPITGMSWIVLKLDSVTTLILMFLLISSLFLNSVRTKTGKFFN